GTTRFLEIVQKAGYDGAMLDTDHASALREAGLRVTAPRLATLGAVAEHPHVDAEAVARAVRERLGTVSRQAVYDILNALTEVELLRRVSVGSRSMRYELHRHRSEEHTSELQSRFDLV